MGKAKTKAPTKTPPGSPKAPAGSPKAPAETAPAPAAPQPFWKNLKLGGGKVTTRALTEFTTQLSILQEAGLPIVRSLRILESQLKAGALQHIVGTVADDVESGVPLSEALSRHPQAFDKLFVNMVRAGEAGGVLDTMLRRLADFLEKSEKLKKKVKGAMIYPAVVLSVAFLIVLGIMVFVIPKFVEMFTSVNVPLPLPTRILMGVSEFVASVFGLFVVLGIPVGVWAGFKVGMKSEAGQLLRDKISLQVPVFGKIIRKNTISRFTRTFGTLVQAGVPILDALAIVKNAIGNMVLSNAIEKVHNSIREGEAIADPLKESKLFDDVIVNMIDVGEETGELDKMLLKVSDNIDYEVEVLVESLVSALEPLLIVVLGTIVGGIVISLFLPMITLIQSVGA